MARGSSESPRAVITNAESIKNIPIEVPADSLVNGNAFVYENNKLILKKIEVPQGGATRFTELTDTPSSYSGYGGKLLAVGSLEEGLIFVDPQTIDSEQIKKDTLKSIIAGSNIKIVENPAGTITINSLGDSGGVVVNKLSDILDVPQYKNGVLTYKDNVLTWEGPKDYSSEINAVKELIPTTIKDLSDVPDYSTSTNNSVLTKTATGLGWIEPKASGGGGGNTFKDISSNLNLVTGTKPFTLTQTGGSTYCTLGVNNNYPCQVRIYSNGDMDVYGGITCKVLDISALTNDVISDALRFSLYLPVPQGIEVNKEYKPTRTGMSIENNPYANMYTANTYYRSGTVNPNGSYVVLNFAWNCLGNPTLYKALSNYNMYISFSAKLIATDKVV